MLKYLFDFFLFTSVFIAGCAIVMVLQTNQLLSLDYDVIAYLAFVFCSTLCSYNFHWFLSADATSENARVQWTQQHKTLHLVLTVLGGMGSVWYFIYFIEHWLWLCGAGLLTFLYTAPKLQYRPFSRLRQIAVGKTVFLTFVWMYVTTFLPMAIDNQHWNMPALLFCAHRFFLIYAICILFDYRDRDYDRQAGIRSMITHLNERGINNLFALSLSLFAFCTIALFLFGYTMLIWVVLLMPGIIAWALYNYAKHHHSDYLYYFVLDGLMMFSGLIMLFLPK